LHSAAFEILERPGHNVFMREWNAETYHRVSNPQFDWGTVVLARLPLHGDECVLDVGCGTGRLTEKLLARLPRGRVVGIDLSSNMVRVARDYLHGQNARVHFLVADASAMPVFEQADAVFSTATFHWVLDHPRLFRSLRDALRPGGLLVAQCGGARNLTRIHRRTAALMAEPRWARFFEGWSDPWEFADAETTARRLADAGFDDIHTTVEASPVVFPDADSFSTFITNVICRPHLACLPDGTLKDEFITAMTREASADDPRFELDYWRLNISARRPPSRARQAAGGEAREGR
jgi:trans-aconitate 2-methyltransferase